MNRRSLTVRLSLLVAGLTVLVGGAAGAWSYLRALDEARSQQDDVLVQVAELAAVTTARQSAGIDELPLTDTASDIDVTSLKRSGLPASTPPGLGTATIDGEPRRYVVARSSTGSDLVVSQSLGVRDEVARGTALAALLPVLLLVPVLVVAIFWVVRRVMRPVNLLAEQVEARDATDLRPLHVEDAPTELRGFLAALNAQFASVEASVARERLFIAEAAHELRTPMTAMSLQLERAAIAPDSVHLRERLAELSLGVERSRHLVDQLLDLARAQAGTADATPPQPLGTLVRQVVGDLLPAADARGTELEVELGDAAEHLLPTVPVTSILANLLDNAIRHGASGGQVRLRAASAGGAVVLSVDDDGPGIASPEHVLRPFAREASQEVPGSGLGLPIVAEQARQLHGRLEVGVTPLFAHGTRAVVTIPVAPPGPEAG